MLQVKGLQPSEVFKDCQTESERKKELVKHVEAHGFCVACMLHCHEGHEVNELYCKLDFRCDCGNAKLPAACHIDGSMDETNKDINSSVAEVGGKATRNEDNIYNSTFFDIYCNCKKPHTAESIDNYMI